MFAMFIGMWGSKRFRGVLIDRVPLYYSIVSDTVQSQVSSIEDPNLHDIVEVLSYCTCSSTLLHTYLLHVLI